MSLLLEPTSPPLALRSTDALPGEAVNHVRRRMMLEFCKWDPQVGDVSTIAPFALLMPRSEWEYLAQSAEALAAETMALEAALLDRPELHRELAVPRVLRNLLNSERESLTPPALRIMRFDFHPTADGWRISEVNSDVPGGFSEASALPALMNEHYPHATTAGNPAAVYVEALSRHGRSIALLSAPGFMEDQQIVANLARLLRARGRDAHPVQPHQLQWSGGRAFVETAWHRGPVDAIVRFYQAEWLARLPRRVRWQPLFAGGLTPVVNPPAAVLSESKRLPLVWDRLNVSVRNWRRFLPETRDPRDVPWRRDERWLLKTAYCNNGDSVTLRHLTPRKQWHKTCLDVWLNPRQWVAQQRFDTTPIDTPSGPMFACIGVYVIDDRACGIYARLSPQPVIRYDAVDVAVLIDQNASTRACHPERTREGSASPRSHPDASEYLSMTACAASAIREGEQP
jgi:glutathionylspermidine synthase